MKMEEKEVKFTENDKEFAKGLAHSGIKGMRWGVRRFQNPDGTLTDLGKRRYGNPEDADPDLAKMNTGDIKAANTRRKQIDTYIKNNPTQQEISKKIAMDNLEGTKDIASNISSASREAANLSNTVSRMGGASKKTRQEIASMSDAELRQRINRETMESQYANMHPSKLSRGASRAADALSIVGGIAAVAASVAGTVYVIKKMRD